MIRIDVEQEKSPSLSIWEISFEVSRFVWIFLFKQIKQDKNSRRWLVQMWENKYFYGKMND